jgi:hypothetical protein
MIHGDRDTQDADLIQRSLLGSPESHQRDWLDKVLDGAMWTLSIALMLIILFSPAIWWYANG